MKWIRLATLILIYSCTSLENAPIGSSNSFMKIYAENENQFNEAKDIRVLTNGYVAIGNSVDEINNIYETLIYRFDNNGNIVGEVLKEPNFLGYSITVVNDSEILIVGDRQRQIDDEDDEFISSLSVLRLENGSSTPVELISESTHPGFYDDENDIHGYSVLTTENSEYVVLGSVETDQSDEVIWAGFNETEILWQKQMLGTSSALDIEGSRSIHRNGLGAYILNANRTERPDEVDITKLYIGSFQPDSNLPDGNTSAEDLQNSFTYSQAEIQPVLVDGNIRYGVAGTTDENGEEDTDIFFLLLNEDGAPSPSLYRVYADLISGTEQNSESDKALGLDPTSDDGFIILGARGTIPGQDDNGNGGMDFLLIKTDKFGGRIWDRVIGSSGEEAFGAVRQANDGGYIIFGTSDFNGLSNFVLIKTDAEGNLR